MSSHPTPNTGIHVDIAQKSQDVKKLFLLKVKPPVCIRTFISIPSAHPSPSPIWWRNNFALANTTIVPN
jgi:hypothetical protein